MIKKYIDSKKGMKDAKRIDCINNLMYYNIKNFDNLIQSKIPKNVNSVEIFLKSILTKKIEFDKDLKIISLKPENNTLVFVQKMKRLKKKCEILNKIIYDYFIQKSIFVLFKTNRDAFRIVMEFII